MCLATLVIASVAVPWVASVLLKALRSCARCLWGHIEPARHPERAFRVNAHKLADAHSVLHELEELQRSPRYLELHFRNRHADALDVKRMSIAELDAWAARMGLPLHTRTGVCMLHRPSVCSRCAP